MLPGGNIVIPGIGHDVEELEVNAVAPEAWSELELELVLVEDWEPGCGCGGCGIALGLAADGGPCWIELSISDTIPLRSGII